MTKYRLPDEPEYDSEGRRIRLLHPFELKIRLAGEQNWRCCLCGCHLNEGPGTWATFEHIVDFAEGGLDDESNIVITCERCNNGRNTANVATKNLNRVSLKLHKRERYAMLYPDDLKIAFNTLLALKDKGMVICWRKRRAGVRHVLTDAGQAWVAAYRDRRVLK